MSVRFMPGLEAQRVVYPNGTRSNPFVVPMCKRDLARFSRRILEGQWPETNGCLDANGRVDFDKLAVKRAADDFDSGSSSLEGAHQGRFWRTVDVLRMKCVTWDAQVGDVLLGRSVGRATPIPGNSGDRMLSECELAIVFGAPDRESSWRALFDLGIEDPVKALARTVL